MAKKKTRSSKKPPSFEEALAQLKQCLEALESDDLTLDESLAQYESGVGHLKHCHRAIATAKQKIEKLIKIDSDGNALLEVFDNTASEKTTTGTRRSTPPAQKSAKPRSNGTQIQSPENAGDMDDSDGLF